MNFVQTFRLTLTYQLRRFPLAATFAMLGVLVALSPLLRYLFPGYSTAELSQQLLISWSDLGCCLLTLAWATDFGQDETSTKLDDYLRSYTRYAFTRSLGFLLGGWLVLAGLATVTVGIVSVASLTGPEGAELRLALISQYTLSLWLKLLLIYTVCTALRYALKPSLRLSFALMAFGLCYGLFHLSPHLPAPIALEGIMPTLALVSMDYSQFAGVFGQLYASSEAASGTVLPLSPLALQPALITLAILVLTHELSAFFSELAKSRPQL